MAARTYQIKQYNSYKPAGESRLVVGYAEEFPSYEIARATCLTRALVWNRDETRENMLINILVIDDKVMAV